MKAEEEAANSGLQRAWLRLNRSGFDLKLAQGLDRTVRCTALAGRVQPPFS